VKGADAVLSCFGPRGKHQYGVVSEGTEAILAAMQGTDCRRIIAISGAGVSTAATPARPHPPKREPETQLRTDRPLPNRSRTQRSTRHTALARRRRAFDAPSAHRTVHIRSCNRRRLLNSRQEIIVLDLTLWIAQGFLALFFLAAGLPKVIGRGIDRWVGFDDVPRALTIVIGLSEVAGAAALALPSLIGAFVWTTPLAAIGIAVISLMAIGFHIRAAEWLPAVETALWATLGGSIAIGRWTEIASGPSLPSETLVVAIAVLIPSIIVNLVLLARRPVAPRSADSSPQRMPTAS
jgi:hypothetical protein